MQVIKQRNKLTAIFLAILSLILVQGIGQLYGGRIGKAFLLFGILLLTSLAAALGVMRYCLGAFFIYAITLITVIYFAYDAYKINAHKDGVKLRWYNRWYIYPIFIIIFLFFNFINNTLFDTYKHYRIMTTHNSPILQIGDIVMAEMNYGHRPGFYLVYNEFFDWPVIIFSTAKYTVGSFIFFTHQDNNGEDAIFIRKILALEGETFKTQNGSIKVPKNSVLIFLNDGVYASIPYQNIQGKALYILWSSHFSKIGSIVRDKNNLIKDDSVSENFYIGKTILAEINHYDKKNKLSLSKQIAGKIIKINNNSIVIQLKNSKKEYNLPPDVSALELAPPGIYKLKHGNVQSIENPHFTVIYNVYEHKNNE